MKKFLLIAAAGLTAALSVNAGELGDINERQQYVKNYLVNGNFDDLGYVQSEDQIYNWISDFESYNADSIPGWKRVEGVWNGCVAIYNHEEENFDEQYGIGFNGNNQYTHYQFCTVNGWTGFGLEQQVEGLTPGTEYTLDMYVCHYFSNAEANITYGIEIYDKPLVEGEATGPEIATIKDRDTPIDTGYGVFDYYTHKFTALHDGAIIRIMGYNWAGKDNGIGSCYVDWDEVRLYDPNEEGGINSVAVDGNAVKEVYNLQGVRMPADAELNGVYIVKTGNTVSKVVY